MQMHVTVIVVIPAVRVIDLPLYSYAQECRPTDGSVDHRTSHGWR